MKFCKTLARSQYEWIICERCRGHGMVDHPAFSNGITSSEWADEWDEDSREAYLAGVYDVPCKACEGGRVRQPIIAALSFAQKRELVLARREEAWQTRREREYERGGMYD